MTQDLKDLLGDVLRKYRLEPALHRARLPEYWRQCVGDRLAAISEIRSFEGGVLRVEGVPREGYAIVPLPGGMLHFNDFDLFYANIRANAVARSAAFKAAAPR